MWELAFGRGASSFYNNEGNDMFDDKSGSNFTIDQTSTTRQLLRDQNGYLIAQKMNKSGVFSNWTRTKFIQHLTARGKGTLFKIHSQALTASELVELNRLPIHSIGLLFCHPMCGTWWLAAYLPNRSGEACNNFHNAPGKTGV